MLKPHRVLLWTSLIFIASGLFHAGVWWLADMPSLSGPISWRKPMSFGFSTGVLCLSLAWVLSLLPATRMRVRQAWLFAALLVAEVGLIDMQQWRGVASHFNTATPFDGAVFTAMGVLIAAASTIMAIWTWAALTAPLATTPPLAFAARAGLLLLNVGNLIGVAMAVTKSNELKVVHGLALHAIQVLPVAVLVFTRLGYPRAWRSGSRLSRLSSSPAPHYR